MMKCNYCNDKANIQFKKIKFCNNCFKNKTLKRVKKSLPPNLYGKKVAFLFSGSLKSIVLLDILNETIKNKNISIIFVDENAEKIFNAHVMNDTLMFEKWSVITKVIFKKYKSFDPDVYDFVFNEKTIYDSAIDVLEHFLKGNKIDCKNGKAISPLGSLSDDEVVYYWFLKDKKICFWSEYSRFSKEIRKFIHVLSHKNYSTCPNILSVVEKIKNYGKMSTHGDYEEK